MTVPVDFYRQLGRRIATFRKSASLSQERLGERAQVGASYVAHIEIGSRKPTIDVLRRIAEAVDVPLWRLLTDDRLTGDEKAWDAAARELANRVQGLAQPDLQALTYLATRLKTAEASKVVHPKTLVHPRAMSDGSRSPSSSIAARAVESPTQNWKPSSQRTRSKRSR